jgi:hypothetical protein
MGLCTIQDGHASRTILSFPLITLYHLHFHPADYLAEKLEVGIAINIEDDRVVSESLGDCRLHLPIAGEVAGTRPTRVTASLYTFILALGANTTPLPRSLGDRIYPVHNEILIGLSFFRHSDEFIKCNFTAPRYIPLLAFPSILLIEF